MLLWGVRFWHFKTDFSLREVDFKTGLTVVLKLTVSRLFFCGGSSLLVAYVRLLFVSRIATVLCGLVDFFLSFFYYLA